MAAFGHTTVFERVFFETIFSIDMILSCITEFPMENNNKPERRISAIIKMYLSKDFIWDLIPLVPI